MVTDILIVSCVRHFDWLRFCLRSIARFATGFRQVKVLIPADDLSGIGSLLAEFTNFIGFPIRVGMFEDWPDKGFLRHEHVIMCADEFTDADFIFHFDSDCMFVEPTTPADYFENGKPILLHASYHWLVTTQQANLGMWKDAVEKAIGGTSTEEFMRRPQMLHPRKTYAMARRCIEIHTGKSCADYIRSCENAFPQTFAEHNTLGEVAWQCFHDDYRWWNQETEGFPKPHKVVQWWSHAPPTEPQAPMYKDEPWPGTPEQLLQII
jgi:hypothetical protein